MSKEEWLSHFKQLVNQAGLTWIEPTEPELNSCSYLYEHSFRWNVNTNTLDIYAYSECVGRNYKNCEYVASWLSYRLDEKENDCREWSDLESDEMFVDLWKWLHGL